MSDTQLEIPNVSYPKEIMDKINEELEKEFEGLYKIVFN